MEETAVAIGLSVAALIISIVVPIFEFFWTRKMNDKNLAAEYFKKLFEEIIFIELPKAREYIHFDGENITGTEKLEDVMRLLRQKLIYFKKSNVDFYNGLLHEIQEFENLLVNQSGKSNSGLFAEFHNAVDDHIERIYTYINNVYLGKKTK